MPYKLRKAPKRELYWVVGQDGKKHSKDPLPKERAEAQMRALYAAESGSLPPPSKRKTTKRKLKGGDIGEAIESGVKNVALPAINKVVPGLGNVLGTVGDAITGLFTDQGAIQAEQQRQQQIQEQKAAYEQKSAADAAEAQRISQSGTPAQKIALASMSAGFGKASRKRIQALVKKLKSKKGKGKRRGKGDDEEMEELVKAFATKAEVAKPKESGRESRAAKPIAKPIAKPKKGVKEARLAGTKRRLSAIAEEKEGEMEGEGKRRYRGGSNINDVLSVIQHLRDQLVYAIELITQITPFIANDPGNEEIQQVYSQLAALVATLENQLTQNLELLDALRSGDPERPDTPSSDPGALEGSGPMPQRSVLHKIATASYQMSPPQSIERLKLVSYTPTLKFYEAPDKTIVVGIRGTEPTDKRDLLADGRLSIGELEGSDRFKDDLRNLLEFQMRYPRTVYDYYGVGHSLGGAVLDEFLKRGLLKSGLSYNPAVQVGDFERSIPNQRVYQEGDPLYELMGKNTKGAEVKKGRKKSWWEKIVEKVPYAGKAVSYYKSHQLDNFVGGGKYTDKLFEKVREAVGEFHHRTGIDPYDRERSGPIDAILGDAIVKLRKIGTSARSDMASRVVSRAEAKEQIIRDAVQTVKDYLKELIPPKKEYAGVGFKDNLRMMIHDRLFRYPALPAEAREKIKELERFGLAEIKKVPSSHMRSGSEKELSASEVLYANLKSDIVKNVISEVDTILSDYESGRRRARVRDVLPTEAEIRERERREEQTRERERQAAEQSRVASERTKVEFPPTRPRGGKKKVQRSRR